MDSSINISSSSISSIPVPLPSEELSIREQIENSPFTCKIIDSLESFCVYVIAGIALSILFVESFFWGCLGMGMGCLTSQVTSFLFKDDGTTIEDVKTAVRQFEENHPYIFEISYIFAVVIGILSVQLALFAGFVPSFFSEFLYEERLMVRQQTHLQTEANKV